MVQAHEQCLDSQVHLHRDCRWWVGEGCEEQFGRGEKVVDPDAGERGELRGAESRLELVTWEADVDEQLWNAEGAAAASDGRAPQLHAKRREREDER